jgi:hypothetical protein
MTMRKMAQAEKSARHYQPSPDDAANPVANPDSGLFFRHLTKVAGITKKEWVYGLRVSDTLIDGYMNGSKRDPFTTARAAAKEIREKGRGDLLPVILLYVAGAEQFDGVILTAEQHQALKLLSGAVK